MTWKVQETLKRLAKGGTRAATVFLVLLGLAPPAQAGTSTQITVNDRIGRIRAALEERTQNPADVAPREEPGEVKLAQWGNWGNWPNWGNWGNWGNGG